MLRAPDRASAWLLGLALVACGLDVVGVQPEPPIVGPDGGGPTCSDGTKNGTETDVDCGGSCGKCALSKACARVEDCAEGSCTGGVCVGPGCSDGKKNGTETAIDCGGPSCAPCADGLTCASSRDCRSRHCDTSICRTPSSCKSIRAADPDASDGVYMIDPDADGSTAPFEAFCEMTTDGGGWTFFAHANQDYVAGRLFEVDFGTYRSDRVDDETSFGRAGSILLHIPHTEMMVTLDGAIPRTASDAKKIIFYQYAPGNPAFAKGPVPCQGLGLSAYGQRTSLAGAFEQNGAAARCDAATWWAFAPKGYLACFSAEGPLGNYWGIGMGGDNSWNHDGFWYVR